MCDAESVSSPTANLPPYLKFGIGKDELAGLDKVDSLARLRLLGLRLRCRGDGNGQAEGRPEGQGVRWPTGIRPADAAAPEADTAMRLLSQALDVGNCDAHFFRTEHALVPLRDRPDFRLLMMDLAFPADPFAH